MTPPSPDHGVAESRVPPLTTASAVSPTPDPWPLTPDRGASLSEPAIVVDHLARRFGGRVILQDVSFTVAPGMSFGIAAANGAGKTVLLRLIASLDRPTAGRIAIHGYDTIRRARAVRHRIGYVPGEPMLYD